jgi:outer membrane protein assembly factor BamB
MIRKLVCALMLTVAATASAGDWPQWLGPHRNGSSTEKIAAWIEAPPVVWKQEVGTGYSSPVVANGRAFVHARVGQSQDEEIVAFDALTGQESWREKYPRTTYNSVLGGGPAATPTVSGNKIFSYGISGMLSCHDVETGRRLWQRDVYQDLKVSVPRYGVCCSPLVVGNHVIVSVGGKDSAVVAIDAQSGEYAWKAFDEPATTSSPILYRAPGQEITEQAALFVTSLRVLAIDPLDGQKSWEAPQQFKPSGPAPTPLAIGDIVITSNSNDGTVATRISQSTDGVRSEQLWSKKDVGGYFSSGVRCGEDKVCLVTNVLQPVPSASLRCLDAVSGEEQWVISGAGYFHAGVIQVADNRLLVLDDSGTLKLYEAGDKKCTQLAKAPVCLGTLVTPALSNGLLYARDGTHLVCVRLGTP